MRFSSISKSVLLGSTMMCLATPAFAAAEDGATKADDENGNNIVVVARRTEEKLQDVPISITVLSAKALANNNISSAKDIATYTPGLSTNNRYGSDNTTWTVRGFTQEQRTTATVGTFFADVVAPRGNGATQGGDGAGPGNLFDLSSVQVLKGPQGTLQGRNSTGGAVMLVPNRPTDKFEGYLEGSAGNYSMWRVQGVVNVPINDTFKVRVGVDRQKRDGYLKNVGKVGFGPYGNAGGSLDYWAARIGVIANFTPDLENYMIGTWSHSKSTGVIPKITQAFYRDPYSGSVGVTGAAPTSGTLDAGAASVSGVITSNGLQALNQMAYENTACGGNWWCVSNSVWDSRSESQTWQFIDTLTWHASDSLTVKNITSYGEFIGDTTLDLFGFYNPAPVNSTTPIPTNAISTAQFDAVTTPLGVRNFSMTRSPSPLGMHTNAESSFVEELQFQGHGDVFNWQGGLYFEMSNPLGKSGTFAASQTPCGPLGSALPAAGGASIQTDAASLCILGQTGNSLGRVGLSTAETRFRDKAVYWQGIYKLTDQIKLTAGIRYTWDTMSSDFALINLRYYNSVTTASGFNGTTLSIPGILNSNTNFAQGVGFCNNNVAFGTPGTGNNQYFPANEALAKCLESHTVKTSAPTWLLGVDYKPMDDMLLYAKYSRGYRQGGVAAFGLDQAQDYKAEKVDTFEVGAKTSWRGAMPGYFNLSAFTNNFTDQQLQIGISCNPTSVCPQTTAIVNAGKSRLQGFEVEAGISPFEGFRLSASYAYLKTSVLAITDVSSYILSKNSTLVGLDVRPLPIGSPIPNAVPHKLVVSGSYTLPLPDSFGKLSFGGTFVYQSSYRAVSDPNTLAGCYNGAPSVFVNGVATGLTASGAAAVLATPATNSNSLNCVAAQPFAYASTYGILPSSKVVNLNVNWENVGGMPIDASFFVTNLTKAKTILHANVQSAASAGFVSNIIGEPQMFGFRLKYRFGS